MTEAQKPAPSRLLPWVVAIGLGIPLALIALAASPLGPNFVYVVVAIPALLFLWVIAGLGAFIVSIRSAMQKKWRRCIIAAILPVVLFIVAFDPIRFVRSCNYIGDVIHFIVMKSYYDQTISASQPTIDPVWSCSTGGACHGPHMGWSTMRPIKSPCREAANPPIG